MKKFVLIIFAAASLTACKGNNQNKQDEKPLSGTTESAANHQQEWQYLFNGSSAQGWRGYNSEDGLPDGWVIENGALKSLGKGGDIGGDIVYGEEEFGEFELSLEWKISKGGNSGIFYHVVEEGKYDAPYYVAPEYQIVDQVGFPSKLEPWQSIGADYGMYDPNYKEEDLKEAGEWNTSTIIYTNDKVTYLLNGKITAEFDPSSEDWEKRRTERKWKDFPDYGSAKKGFIGLQDHGDYTWFKNIKIRKL